jgi:DNA-binding IclR family transcriptional regulator
MESVDRVCRVLQAFLSAGVSDLGVTEVASSCELPKSVAHRIMASLATNGFLSQDRGSNRYRLGSRAVALGLVALGGHDLRQLASAPMEWLSRRTNETVTLSLRIGDERMYESQVEASQDIKMRVEIGQRHPLHIGASGKAILAFMSATEISTYLDRVRLTSLTDKTITSPVRLLEELEQTRARGFAISAGERDPWAAAVAAPVYSGQGVLLGAMSVCGPRFRFEDDVVPQYGALVVEATNIIAGKSASAFGSSPVHH